MKARKSKDKVLVYCGPTIKNVCTQWQTFSNGPHELLKELMDKNSKIKALVVPLEEFPHVRLSLDSGEGRWAALYRAVKEEL